MAKAIDIIKYEGPNDVFVWKHPTEDFLTGTQLIVHESQEALFFHNGQALDLFPAGKHVLESTNLPLLWRILSKPFGGGKVPFHCEVYFINKVQSMDVLWGTASPIPLQDPIHGIILPVGASGQFGVQVIDSRKLCVKLVGTIQSFDQQTLVQYFRGLLMNRIKDYISKQIILNQISILQIGAYYSEISDAIEKGLAPVFEEYGIKLINFFIQNISPSESDPNYLELQEIIRQQMKYEKLGYSYEKERSFDVMERAASNEGSAGGVMGMGMGLGMGVGMGNMAANTMGSITDPQNLQQNGPLPVTPDTPVPCAKCGANVPANAKFCLSCGEPVKQQGSEETLPCPSCGEPVPKGAKFCMGCGQKIQQDCPECGKQLPPGAKFCMDCGHKID